MRFRSAFFSSLFLATAALAQNSAPVFSPRIPDLTVAPGTVPLSFYLTNSVTDPDLQSVEGTQVKFDTTQGAFNLEMFDAQKPVTVGNFLNYVNSGRYTNSMIHRSVFGFVIQGGGYTYPPDTVTTVTPTPVPSFGTIQNEPGISNTTGTIAMARKSGQPNSATNQWFINLNNNGGTAPNGLDFFDGGYAVFGRVIEGGMTQVNFLANVPRFDKTTALGAEFNTIPLQNYNLGKPVKGNNVMFVKTATAGPKMTYSAVSDNPTIANPVVDGSKLTITPGNTGMATVTVTARDFNGLTATSVSTVTVGANPPPGKLRNISTRSNVQTGENVLIAGFIIQGTGTKRLLIRVLGSELSRFGLTGLLGDPYLELHDATSTIASNNTWTIQTNPADVAAIQATPYAPTDIQEPALLATLPAGEYTVVVRGVSGTTGNGLVEVYELDSTDTARLGNISTRAAVGTGNNVLIGGFIVNGTTPKRVIVRARGTSLAPFLQNPLMDPKLEVYAGGKQIAKNDDWQLASDGSANPDKDAIIASGRAPTADQESAVILTLPPGEYTAIVRGANNTVGVGLVEVYDLD